MKKIVFAQAAALLFFGLAHLASGQNARVAATGRHKVQVNDPALAGKMAAAGARLIADYGGYQLYDAPDSMTNLPPDKADMRDDYNLVMLNAGRLDTTTEKVKALRKTVGGFDGKRMHLVQFAGPVQPDWRQSLLDAGAQIVSYIPQNSYLIYGDAATIARVQALAAAKPVVQWEGAYLDDYKIHPLAKPGAAKTDQFTIQLISDDDANAATLALLDQLKLAPLARQRPLLGFVNVVVRVSAANLAQIAARPDVVSIQPYGTPRKLCERQDQIIAGNLSGSVPSGPGYLAWLQSKGFAQSQFGSFAVDVSDSGVDDGTTHPNHFGLYLGGIVNSANSRVIYNRVEGTPNAGSTLAGCDGHGNINAHIVGGYDNGSGFPFADSSGFHYGLGVCPFVSLGSSVIFDPTNWTNPSYEDLMSQAYEDKARISNNSWGDTGDGASSSDGLYNSDSQKYDSLVRDAQPTGSTYATAGNQEMVIVFASGNDGPDASTVSAPGTAKNVFTIGAAENVQPFGGANDGSDLGGVTDDQANNANAIIDFSGEGPCADGRQKPDLVAPGTHISGGAPQAANPGTDGTALACFLDIGTNEIGVDGGSDNSIFFPDTGQEFYTASSGTSHSTPCVSGGCALLRQYFINQGWSPPSPAMTKAWLMNSARYLNGAYADDTLWSPSQGMGEMNLGMAFDGTPRLMQDELSANIFTASGQTRVFTGTIANSSEPFRVTVAWTDAPGNTTGDAYNNDLDLTVTVGGNSYKGNVFSGSNSVTGGSADPRNNVESVFLPAGVSGAYTVTITATSVNSVGVPGATGAVNQDFALVVYNSGSVPAPVLTSAVVTIPANGVINPGQNVTVNFILHNAGSASTTNLVATLLSSNGIALPSGPQTYGALAPGSSGANAYSFVADGACGGVITALLQLQDGTANLGTVSYSFQLGQAIVTSVFIENFNEANLTLPNLPAGWTTSNLQGQSVVWATESDILGTTSNAAFCPDSAFIDEVFLVSPPITLPAESCQLSYRQSYDLESGYDGGVLQIKIGNGTFTDIITAGGSFIANGYVAELTELGDRNSCLNTNLLNRNVWTGDSGGAITTLVNLPASAEGQTIQLQWACATDCENSGSWSGWWIGGVLITGTNWSCGSVTNGPVPIILSPANGEVTNVAGIPLSGTAMAGEVFTLLDNGASNATVTVDSSGVFNANVTLTAGTNVFILTNNGSAIASSPVTVFFLPAAPTLTVAAVSAPLVEVSGTGLAGAVVNLFTNGVLAANFNINASGNFAGSITLPAGSNLLFATLTENGLISPASATYSVFVTTVPAPVILFPPANGLLTNNGSFVITGTGVSGATVTLYDDGANISGAPTVNSSGAFSLTVNLSAGVHVLTATQNSQGVASPSSAAVMVTIASAPVITAQPSSLNGFLKEKVILSANAYGVAPLRFWWEKNGVKIAGATTTNLTLPSLTSSSAASYVMFATNKYGFAATQPAVITLVANPFTGLTGIYYGLFEGANAQFASAGFLKLTLGSLGVFSANILNAGGSYSFSGAFTSAGNAALSVSRGKGLEPLIVNMNLDVSANDTEQITGTVSSASWSANLQADRATFGPANEFLSHGKYTMSFPNASDGGASPGGDGYGTVNISTAGMVSWSGVLADNTSVAPAAVSVSKSGQWPLYIPLYGKLGSLSGWITIPLTAAGGFSGEANWFRVGASGKLYPNGFTNALSIVGSAFTAGSRAIPVLDSTSFILTLGGGGLGENLTNGLTLSGTGKFQTNTGNISKLTLSVSPATGVISGSFLDTFTGMTATLKGVVLQDQTNGAGFFLGTGATGSFILTAP